MHATKHAIIMRLAVKYVDNNITNEESARLCLADARALEAEGRYDDARKRALDSLRYSIGVLSPEYQMVLKALDDERTERLTQVMFDRIGTIMHDATTCGMMSRDKVGELMLATTAVYAAMVVDETTDLNVMDLVSAPR